MPEWAIIYRHDCLDSKYFFFLSMNLCEQIIFLKWVECGGLIVEDEALAKSTSQQTHYIDLVLA